MIKGWYDLCITITQIQKSSGSRHSNPLECDFEFK